jgi:hypothetical protein
MCTLLGIVLASLVAPHALAAHPGGGDTVKFVTHLNDPGDYLTVGGVDPRCQVGQGVIAGPPGGATLRGQLHGNDTGYGCFSWDPFTQLNDLESTGQPAFAASGYVNDHVVGMLVGCGKGRITLHLHNLRVTSLDPVARTIHLELKWDVPAGSGTGNFLGATGRGTGSLDGTVTPDVNVPLLTAPVVTPNWGTYQGTITCPHHD